jgi:four helix bundle protein
MELETHLIIANNLEYLASEQLSDLRNATRQVGKMLNGLIKALKARRTASPSP